MGRHLANHLLWASTDAKVEGHSSSHMKQLINLLTLRVEMKVVPDPSLAVLLIQRWDFTKQGRLVCFADSQGSYARSQ